ncbi:MAG: V-type ATP synthase subunit A [Steroidobacteraceae bacterium]
MTRHSCGAAMPSPPLRASSSPRRSPAARLLEPGARYGRCRDGDAESSARTRRGASEPATCPRTSRAASSGSPQRASSSTTRAPCCGCGRPMARAPRGAGTSLADPHAATCRSRLPVQGPLVTGQRILDTLFPVARGGRAALPGGFGTGKTVLQEALAKWCDADVIVYVGCGERGNEMAEVLDEFPKLEDPRSGRRLIERTVIIANTSNMPVAAREASIYTAITVAEYFRDQGLNVALMADSTSRWAEALREVSGRLGELPGEAGYPAYLSSRLAEFYERAARVTTLAGREGSVTIIGAVSPPAGDFSEPVTLHTKRYVRCFWALDRQRAQARFYPAIHPLLSYSADAGALADWWKLNGNPDWMAQRQRVLALIEQQARLERMVRIVGRMRCRLRSSSR